MITALLYITLATAAYYLVSRAEITRPLWSRYPERLERFALCPACTGFWYGVGAALALGRPLDLPVAGLAADAWYTPAVAGLVTMVWTPIVAAIMVRGWMDLSEAPETED